MGTILSKKKISPHTFWPKFLLRVKTFSKNFTLLAVERRPSVLRPPCRCRGSRTQLLTSRHYDFWPQKRREPSCDEKNSRLIVFGRSFCSLENLQKPLFNSRTHASVLLLQRCCSLLGLEVKYVPMNTAAPGGPCQASLQAVISEK